jgi:hypothetical protein
MLCIAFWPFSYALHSFLANFPMLCIPPFWLRSAWSFWPFAYALHTFCGHFPMLSIAFWPFSYALHSFLANFPMLCKPPFWLRSAWSFWPFAYALHSFSGHFPMPCIAFLAICIAFPTFCARLSRSQNFCIAFPTFCIAFLCLA